MTSAAEIRSAIDANLQSFEENGGRGPDAYCSARISHPMADGKYLQILAVLRESGLLSATNFEEKASNVFIRLESSASGTPEDGYRWGLGFSWRTLPASEPFLITTSIVTRGLLDCHEQGLASALCSGLLSAARAGLSTWVRELTVPVDEPGFALPAYSPGIREPIYNAAAYAMSTLKLVEDAQRSDHDTVGFLPALEWIRSRRVAGLGWPYSPNSLTVDLLHQGYILNALAAAFGVRSIELASAEMIGQFAGPCCFADVLRLVPEGEEPSNLRSIPWLRPLGSSHVELLPKTARLWSLGELLVLLSGLGLDGERSEAWVRLADRIAESILSRLSAPHDAEALFPRHVMHVVHGLSCYLALRRQHAAPVEAPRTNGA